MQNSNRQSESFDYGINFQSSRKESLTDKVRQKINAAGKLIQSNRPTNVEQPDLKNLTARSKVRYQKKSRGFVFKKLFIGTYFTCG
jgi:hypothetical protein